MADRKRAFAQIKISKNPSRSADNADEMLCTAFTHGEGSIRTKTHNGPIRNSTRHGGALIYL